MPTLKESEDDVASDKGGHILEGGQEGFDIVWNLLRGDHQHRNCECKGCVDEGFQSRHLQATQTKSAEPRQRIQFHRHCGRDLLMPLVHGRGDTIAKEASYRWNF